MRQFDKRIVQLPGNAADKRTDAVGDSRCGNTDRNLTESGPDRISSSDDRDSRANREQCQGAEDKAQHDGHPTAGEEVREDRNNRADREQDKRGGRGDPGRPAKF
jgi:hypothetical protein